MTTAVTAPPRRIAVIGNYAPDRQESMQRYGAMLAALLAAQGFAPSFHAPRRWFGRLARRGALAKWFGYVDKFVLFPLVVPRIAAKADAIWISDHSNALYCRFAGRVPTVLTCHDLLAVRAATGDFPIHRPGPTGRLLQWLIRTSMRRADHIVCVSEATQRDVARLIGPLPTTVIENALHYDHAPLPLAETAMRLAAAGIGASPYFLHVGGNQWYKNRGGVIELFARIARHPDYLDHRLVMAGKPLPASARDAIDRHGLRDRVMELVGPDDALLNALYCGAEALLFPSLHEGFGWPIVEAQAAGCPVVTSDRAPMRDVAGPDGALLVDPDDPDAAAAAFLAGRHELMRYRENGERHVARLGRAAAGTQYRAVLDPLTARAA